MIHKQFGSYEKTDPIFDNIKVGNEWLTSTEAASVLKISSNALRILVCRGQVKYFKMGKRLRFSVTDLEALLLKGA